MTRELARLPATRVNIAVCHRRQFRSKPIASRLCRAVRRVRRGSRSREINASRKADRANVYRASITTQVVNVVPRRRGRIAVFRFRNAQWGRIIFPVKMSVCRIPRRELSRWWRLWVSQIVFPTRRKRPTMLVPVWYVNLTRSSVRTHALVFISSQIAPDIYFLVRQFTYKPKPIRIKFEFYINTIKRRPSNPGR